MTKPFFNVYHVPTAKDGRALVEVQARYADSQALVYVVPVARGQDDPEQWTRAITPTPSVLVTMADDVFRFNNDVLGLPIPQSPQVVLGERLDWSIGAMNEEIGEFEDASKAGNVDHAADALIDLVYFALGRLQEMGVAPLPVFKEVHQANMRKTRGELSKRPGSLGYDAVKPANWTAPDHSYLLGLKGEHVEALRALARGEKVLIGHEPAPHTEELTLKVDVDLNASGVPVTEEDLAVLNALSPALREATLLRAKKAEDYQGSSVTLAEYFPFGLVSYAQMLHVKNLRLRSLISDMRKPNHEGIRDTLLDLINYATFAVEAIDAGTVKTGAVA